VRRTLSVRCRLNLVTLLAQQGLEHRPQLGLVLDEQESCPFGTGRRRLHAVI
jgi:hypothetical protein